MRRYVDAIRHRSKMHREVNHARKVLPFPELEPLDVLTDILPHQYRILWQIFSQRLRACVLACVSALASVRPCPCLHTCMHTCVRTHARIRRNCIRVCMQGYTHAAHLAYMHAHTTHTSETEKQKEKHVGAHARTHTHTHTLSLSLSLSLTHIHIHTCRYLGLLTPHQCAICRHPPPGSGGSCGSGLRFA